MAPSTAALLVAASIIGGVLLCSPLAAADHSDVSTPIDLTRPAAWPSGDAGRAAFLSMGFKPLFDGQTLDGWFNPYGHGNAEVVDGEIRLTADRKFFLVTEQQFDNFRLVGEIHLPKKPANSGIMFRCHVDRKSRKKVFGYQAECDGSDRRWSGGLFDESRRGWIYPSTAGRSLDQFLSHEQSSKAAFESPPIRDALRRDGWNQYVITAIDDRIQIEVNGVQTVDFRDTTDARGHIAIQHHGEDGQVYRFRNLMIKSLPEIPAEDHVEIVQQPPVSIQRVNDKVTLVDFGRVAFGNLSMAIPTKGRGHANVHFGERLVDGRIDRRPPGSIRYGKSRIRLSSGQKGSLIVSPPRDVRNTEQTGSTGSHPPAVLTPRRWHDIAPFRWVEVENYPGKLRPEDITRRAAFSKTFNDQASSFQCSHPVINDIYELCKYSIKATTFAGVYVDGDRERIPYEADAYLNQLSHYAVDDDVTMDGRTFDWLMAFGTWPTEWAPHMVFMAYQHYMQHGDAQWVAHRYESLKTKTLLDRVGDDFLVHSDSLDRSKHDIVDWPQAERDGYVFTEINTVVNAFHIEALRRMAVLAEAVGKPLEAKAWREQRRRATQAMHRQLFDETHQRFRDGIGTDHASAHANLFPLAFGLAPQEHVEAVAEYLSQRGMACSVYAAQYLMEGLFEAGLDDYAIDLMVANGDRSWRHMQQSGTTITWEAWDLKYKPNQDWNHAWGAAPANLLPRYVLGLANAAPGWTAATFAPHPGTLEFAKGTIPTAFGPAAVSWKSTANEWTASLNVPKSVNVSLRLPAVFDEAELTVNGRSVTPDRQADRYHVEGQFSGSIEISLRPI